MNDDFDYKPEESSEPEAQEAQENGAAEAPYTDVFSGENTETVDFEAEAAAAAADAANSAAAETEAKAYEAADNMGYVPPAAPAAAEEPAGEPAPAYTQPEPEIPVVEAERTGPSAPYNANPYSYGQPGAQNQGYQYGYQYGAYRQPVQQEPAEPPKKGKGKKVFLSIIALILVFALGVGTSSLFGKTRNFITPAKDGTSEATTVKDDTQITISATPSASKASGAGLTAAQIAEKLSPSNVGILVYSDTAGATASGEGSGIVMGTDKSGQYTYIVTCAHILNTAGTKFKVQTADGTLYDAESVGYDTRTDVGVIKVKATNFKPAEFGNSDDLKVGDPVYAIGNPGGTEFFGSFTGGFVSAINRPINSEIGYTMKCIQHDATINPGNSGGMLVNQYGQVVGINSQKISATNYESMGFAIPITAAKEIIDDLIQFGYVPNRPKLGITYYPVAANSQYYMIAQIKGLPAGTLIINTISSDSSLNGSNVRKYDMITAVNGKELDKSDTLIEMIDNGKVGDKLTLTICRVNSNYSINEFTVDATLVEDRGTEPETTTQAVNPFDFYFNYGN